MRSMQSTLKKYFGYDQFRPLQEDVIRHILSGKDCLVLMPTGGGKSLCFQIPALMMEGTAVVVSPLISLISEFPIICCPFDTLIDSVIIADFWA